MRDFLLWYAAHQLDVLWICFSLSLLMAAYFWRKMMKQFDNIDKRLEKQIQKQEEALKAIREK